LTDCHEPLIRLRQRGLSRCDADNVECHHTEAPKKYAKIIQINTKKQLTCQSAKFKLDYHFGGKALSGGAFFIKARGFAAV